MRIKIRSVQTVNWGLAPYQTPAPELAPGVNVLLGENGSGKTTFLDAVKLSLGQDKFDDDRKIEDYVKEGQNWAAVITSFWNEADHEGKRPFDPLGYFQDVVTAVCRVKKNRQGYWDKEYSLIDGPYDLKQKAGDFGKISYGITEYRKKIGRVGISKTLLNAIALGQGKTGDLCKKENTPAKLFDTIMEITGDAEIRLRFEERKRELAQRKQAAIENENLLLKKQREVEEYRENRRRFKEHAADQRDLVAAQKKKLLAEYKRVAQDRGQAQDQIQKLDLESTELVREEQLTLAKLRRVGEDLKNLDSELKGLTGERGRVTDEIIAKQIALRDLDHERGPLAQFVDHYAKLAPEPVEPLKARETWAAEEIRALEAEEYRLKVELATASTDLDKMERDRTFSPYPVEVVNMKARLGSLGAGPVLFCETIEIEDPKWHRAIEAILAAARFDFAVAPERHVEAMEAGENLKYRSFISEYHEGRVDQRRVPPPGLIPAMSKVTIRDNRIRGWLEFLWDIYLVETVPEGKALARRGLTSVTPQCYEISPRGGRSRWVDALFCGKLARERQIAALREQVQELKSRLAGLAEKLSELRTEREKLLDRIADQENLALLPARRESLARLDEQVDEVRKALGQFQERQRNLDESIDGLNQRKFVLGKDQTALEKDAEAIRGRLEQNRRHTEETRAKVSDTDAALARLRDRIPPDELAFIDQEELKGVSYYEEQMAQLNRAIEEFERLGLKEVDVILSEHAEEEVAALNELVDRLKAEIEQWSQLTEEAAADLERHIKRTIRSYERQLSSLAGIMGARVDVDLIEEGDQRYQLVVRVGFEDGRLWPYNHPRLSGGQKAATSAMILMAAASLDGAFSFMILDEPAAHLDGNRTQELGRLLQATGGQFIVTAPTTSNIRTANWADRALIFSKRLPDAELAPPIVVQENRESFGRGFGLGEAADGPREAAG